MKLLAILCLVQFTFIMSQPIEKSDVEQCEYIEVTGELSLEHFFRITVSLLGFFLQISNGNRVGILHC